MTESEEYETEDEMTIPPKMPKEKGIENNQNNALLYLILKEGYKITLKNPYFQQNETKKTTQKGKKMLTYKCIKIENEEEELSFTDVQEIGTEMNEIIQMKLEQKESQNEKGFITIEPKDLFTDGEGIEHEQIFQTFQL